MKFFLLTFFFLLNILAAYDDSNESVDITKSYLDHIHDAMDLKVHEWGVSIDGTILGVYEFWGGNIDKNNTRFDLSIDENKTTDTNRSIEQDLLKTDVLTEREIVDEFFLTRRLLAERDESYIRVSYSYTLHSLQKEESSFAVRARVGLDRSKKHLKLFIEDLKGDNAENMGKSGANNSASIGIERSSKKRFGIKPRYSIGFRGIHPFVRARYNYEADFGKWHFEPVQTFLYSTKDEFSEITELYLDRKVSAHTLIRFVLDRGTKSHVKGMHYDGFIQYFWTPKKHKALSVNLGFNGSTKYINTIIDSIPPVLKEEDRVFNYLFQVKWREQFWKEWLFYEVTPGVNYHEQHDYRPNYNILFKIDMFFGHV